MRWSIWVEVPVNTSARRRTRVSSKPRSRLYCVSSLSYALISCVQEVDDTLDAFDTKWVLVNRYSKAHPQKACIMTPHRLLCRTQLLSNNVHCSTPLPPQPLEHQLPLSAVGTWCVRIVATYVQRTGTATAGACCGGWRRDAGALLPCGLGSLPSQIVPLLCLGVLLAPP